MDTSKSYVENEVPNGQDKNNHRSTFRRSTNPDFLEKLRMFEVLCNPHLSQNMEWPKAVWKNFKLKRSTIDVESHVFNPEPDGDAQHNQKIIDAEIKNTITYLISSVESLSDPKDTQHVSEPFLGSSSDSTDYQILKLAEEIYECPLLRPKRIKEFVRPPPREKKEQNEYKAIRKQPIRDLATHRKERKKEKNKKKKLHRSLVNRSTPDICLTITEPSIADPLPQSVEVQYHAGRSTFFIHGGKESAVGVSNAEFNISKSLSRKFSSTPEIPKLEKRSASLMSLWRSRSEKKKKFELPPYVPSYMRNAPDGPSSSSQVTIHKSTSSLIRSDTYSYVNRKIVAPLRRMLTPSSSRTNICDSESDSDLPWDSD